MKVIKIDDYYFTRSTRSSKKYNVYDKEGVFIAAFGGIKPNGEPYQQFSDKIGLFSEYDHNDDKRRDNYYARHGKATYESAKWFSHKYLW